MIYSHAIFYIIIEPYSFLHNISMGVVAGVIVALLTIYISTAVNRYNRTYSIPKSNLSNIIHKIKNLKTRSGGGPGLFTIQGSVFEKFNLYGDIIQNEHNLRCKGNKEFNIISNTLVSWLKANTGEYGGHSISSEEFDKTIVNIQEKCSSVKPQWTKVLFNINK